MNSIKNASIWVSIFLTMSCPIGLLAAETLTCSEIFKQINNSSDDANVTAMRQYHIGNPRYNQDRTMQSLYNIIPALKDVLPNLPNGSVVVDLGAGHGVTVGSAVHGSDFAAGNFSYHETVGKETVDSLIHLKFLGITATTAPFITAPHVKSEIDHTLVDTTGRYRILEGRLFEDIPDNELKQYTDGRKVVAFSMVGVFEYTRTPDLAFEKVWKMFSVGDELYLAPSENKIILSNGSSVNYAEYAALCGFKFTEVETITGYYESSEWTWNRDKKINEHARLPYTDISWKLEKTARKFRRIPLAAGHESRGALPPTYTFRALGF